MPFNSSIYTDLELPSLNQDGSTYGTIINTYFQALETKLKNLSDRINAAGVGDSSTLAQINEDIDGILPDPYSGDYSTVSTWPAYNTELTALGLSPPETASEINTFFDGGDFATFANFLNGKLDSLDTLVATAEQDICIANHYSDRILSFSDHYVWSQTATSTLVFYLDPNTYSTIPSGTYTSFKLYTQVTDGTQPMPTGGVRDTDMDPAVPVSPVLADIGNVVVVATPVNGGSFSSGSTIRISSSDTINMVLGSAMSPTGYTVINGFGRNIYQITTTTYTLTLPEPDTSAC